METKDENLLEIERINKEMSEEQKELLRTLAPNYESMDICDIIDILTNELQTKGFEDHSVNEYGIKIEKIIDIAVDG